MLDAKMKDKLTSVVLCAVLVFYAMVPVTDFQKPEKAEAIAPAAVAAVQVFGTVLAAAGVYVAGTSTAQYDANLNSIYNEFQNATSSWDTAWSQYVEDQGSFDQAMQTAVSEGEISLRTFENTGLFESLGTYTAYCVEQGTMNYGSTSLDASSYKTLNGQVLPLATIPLSVTQHSSANDKLLRYTENKIAAGYKLVAYDTNGSYHTWYFIDSDEPIVLGNNGDWFISGCDCYWIFSGGNTSTSTRTWTSESGNAILSQAYEYTTPDSASAVDNVNAAVVDTAANPFDNDVVEPFDPTDEMLAAGISAANITAANTGEIADATGDIASNVGSILSAITTTIGGILEDIRTGVNAIPGSIASGVASGVAGLGTVLNDIKTGVQGLEGVIGSAVSAGASTVVTGVGEAVGALGDVVGDISTTLDNVWNGAQGWWADVLAWLGATPLAQLIAQIIAAVNAGVMTLEGAISAVQSWISTGVAEIVGAIEGIGELIPDGAAQEEPAEPQPGTGVALPPSGLLPSFELDLRSKAPFAYIVAFFETFQDAANTFSSNPSFYLDLKIPSVDENGLDPDGDELRFDAGEWLNYDVNGVTIAFIIRVLVTASICAGLIYVMYNAYLYAFRQ